MLNIACYQARYYAVLLTSLIRDKRVERGELWERISTHLSRKGAEEMSGKKKKLLKHSETHGFAITVFARFSLNFILGCEHERIDLNQAEAPPGQSQENLLSGETTFLSRIRPLSLFNYLKKYIRTQAKYFDLVTSTSSSLIS